MTNNYSLTYSGIIVSLLGLVVHFTGLPLAEAEVTEIGSHLAALVGAIIAIIGRYRIGDVTLLGVKK